MTDSSIGVIHGSRGVFRKIRRYGGLLFYASFCFSSLGQGQQKRGPALPPGDGRQLVTLVCSQCHGLQEIQILRDGQQGWQETVNRMVLYGAQLSPSEADLVTRYLTTQLGPGDGFMPSGATPPENSLKNETKKISLPAGPGQELVATHCVLCHDLGKVVNTARSKADWESVTNNMVQRGMTATPEELKTMITYLQANFSTDTQAKGNR